MPNINTFDGFIILVIILIVARIFHKLIEYSRHDGQNHLDYFIDQLNVDYGGDWYYDEIEDIYKDVMTDRTYARKKDD